MGIAKKIDRNQLNSPTSKPSNNTERKIVKLDAPIARITPNSLVLSITLRDMAPIRPMLPTIAINNAITNKKIVIISNPTVVDSSKDNPASTCKT